MKRAIGLLVATLLPTPAAAQDDLASLGNFLWVEADFCTGAQPSLEHLTRLKEEGVRGILNLRRPREHGLGWGTSEGRRTRREVLQHPCRVERSKGPAGHPLPATNGRSRPPTSLHPLRRCGPGRRLLDDPEGAPRRLVDQAGRGRGGPYRAATRIPAEWFCPRLHRATPGRIAAAKGCTS